MITKHTPGPWINAEAISSVVGLPVVSQTGRVIANVDTIPAAHPSADEFNSESMANARLIAAAPELIAILIRLLTTRQLTKASPTTAQFQEACKLMQAAEEEAYAIVAKARGAA